MFIARNIAKKYALLYAAPASRSAPAAAKLRQKIIHRVGQAQARVLIKDALSSTQPLDASK